MPGEVEAKIAKLGHVLPQPPEPVGFYVPVIRTGNLVLTSGQLPFVGGKLAFKGTVGKELVEADAGSAAELCVLNALAAIKGEIGDLDEVKQVVRVEGFVQSADGFHDQPLVLNNASQLLVDAFGERGKHVRMAIGVNALPLDAPVEIALTVEV